MRWFVLLLLILPIAGADWQAQSLDASNGMPTPTGILLWNHTQLAVADFWGNPLEIIEAPSTVQVARDTNFGVVALLGGDRATLWSPTLGNLTPADWVVKEFVAEGDTIYALNRAPGEAATDLFRYDGEWERLTQDSFDQYALSVSGDLAVWTDLRGLIPKSLLPLKLHPQNADVYFMNLQTRNVGPVTQLGYPEATPAVDAEGTVLYSEYPEPGVSHLLETSLSDIGRRNPRVIIEDAGLVADVQTVDTDHFVWRNGNELHERQGGTHSWDTLPVEEYGFLRSLHASQNMQVLGFVNEGQSSVHVRYRSFEPQFWVDGGLVCSDAQAFSLAGDRLESCLPEHSVAHLFLDGKFALAATFSPTPSSAPTPVPFLLLILGLVGAAKLSRNSP